MLYKHSYTLVFALIMAFAMVGCNDDEPTSDPTPTPTPDPAGTYRYSESTENFPNPERGFYVQKYFESSDESEQIEAADIQAFREGEWKGTLYLHSYYMSDYIKGGDLSQGFLTRLSNNLTTLRQNGAKCVLRFSYSHDDPGTSFVVDTLNPADAKPQVIEGHINQLKPYLQDFADVIFCVQAGFIGTWGEWYYSTYYGYPLSEQKDYEARWKIVNQLMDALPSTRQIGFRYVSLKHKYCQMHGLDTLPLTAATAHKGDARSRWAAHNDAFVSSQNDLGTYRDEADRVFLEQDSKFIAVGGESCNPPNYFSQADRAIAQMERFHWTYLHNNYRKEIIKEWREADRLDEIKRRLGYRLVLDKAVMTAEPKAGQEMTVNLTIRNVGFAAPVNARDVELIYVSTANSSDKRVFKQNVDPRFWMGGDTTEVKLSATLPADMTGEYNLYLNLPDPYTTLHDDPKFSIRLANVDVWNETTGYNKLATITIK